MSFITGVGLTSFGKHEGSSSLDLMRAHDVAGFRHSGAVRRTEPGTGILGLACARATPE